MPPSTEVASYVGGFVAGEGTFLMATPKFTVAVSLGATDQTSIDLLHTYFGVGTVHWYARRKPHDDDEVVFQVRRTADLVGKVVPFMDEHLPVSHKREQYLVWRAALLDHWEHHARRRRPCTFLGCEAPQRAKGLCRSHYYDAYGQ